MILKKVNDIRLKRFLRSTKWFSFTSVIVLFISMGILILIGIHKLVIIIKDIFVLGIKNLDAINMNIVSARIIGIIDIYLLVIVLYILAIGLYKLFIGPFEGYTWMEIDDLNDLKRHIAKVIVLFLSTFLLQKIVEYDEHDKILNFGIVIIGTMAVLIWFSITLKNKNHN